MNVATLPDSTYTVAPMLTAVHGPNLSGRTTRLLDAIGRTGEPAATCGGAYVGLEAHNHISGLATTVRDELALHAHDGIMSFELEGVLGDRLRGLLDRHPLTLSGGEQAMVALASALVLRPSTLALDCATEQFSDELRTAILQELRSWAGRDDHALIIADNRIEEFGWLEPDQAIHCRGSKENGAFAARRIRAARAPSGGRLARPIRLQSVGFTYSGHSPVLHNVSQSLAPGRVILLDGDNGSGKSTLAKLLAGIIKPMAGRIEYDGEVVSPWRSPAGICGYHFQNPDVGLFTTSVSDEVLISSIDRRTAHEWLDALGLADLASTHPLDLPFSIRKRVALAATLATPAPWLVIDEPTLGQDDAAATELAILLKASAEKGRGIIVISHSRTFRACLSDYEHLKMLDGTLRAVEARG